MNESEDVWTPATGWKADFIAIHKAEKNSIPELEVQKARPRSGFRLVHAMPPPHAYLPFLWHQAEASYYQGNAWGHHALP